MGFNMLVGEWGEGGDWRSAQQGCVKQELLEGGRSCVADLRLPACMRRPNLCRASSSRDALK